MDSRQREQDNRTICYTPLPSQADFHQLSSRFKGFSGPVGSGKSKALCYEAIRMCYLNPGRIGLLGAPTYRMLNDTTLAAMLQTMGEHGIPWRHNRADQTLTLLDTKAKILLRSLSSSDSLRGTNLSWFGVDELTYTTEESWMQLEARLRDPRATQYCGFGVWTPKGADWVYRRFLEAMAAEYKVIAAKPFENSYILGRNPRYYDLLMNSYCEAEYRQEVLGQYNTGDHNQVYGAFDRKLNLIETTRDLGAPLLWAFDFNVDPMCSIVAQRNGEQLIVLDELVLRRSGTKEMCEEFVERYGDHQAPVRIYGDASGNSRSTKGASDYEIVRGTLARNPAVKFTLTVPRQNPKVLDRVSLVNALLKSPQGGARLFIDRKCEELTKDLQELRFKEKSSIIDKASDPDRSHLSDALGYLVWQEFSQIRPHGEQHRRLL